MNEDLFETMYGVDEPDYRSRPLALHNEERTMRIEIDTPSYNERRYGKPWIATVDFSASAKGEFSFGDWVGQPGDEGVLTLVNVQVGDVIARGQKDTRQPRNSAPDFYVVDADGDLRAVSKADAYKHWQQQEEEDARIAASIEDPTQDLNLRLEATPAEALALAQFVKRVGWVEFRQNAVDDDEAYLIRAGVAKLQSALAEHGYSPR